MMQFMYISKYLQCVIKQHVQREPRQPNDQKSSAQLDQRPRTKSILVEARILPTNTTANNNLALRTNNLQHFTRIKEVCSTEMLTQIYHTTCF